MAISHRGEVVGSVSGGCVESDVYLRCQEVLESGQVQTVTYGVGEADALSVGLTCGGQITLVVFRVDPEQHWIDVIIEAADSGRDAFLVIALEDVEKGKAVLLDGEDLLGSTGNESLDAEIARRVPGESFFDDGEVMSLECAWEGREYSAKIFALALTPPPRMLIFGSTDHASATADVGKLLGYRVTVCDVRPVFTTDKRFPSADEVVVQWPEDYLVSTKVDHRSVICVLTHDPRFDIPLIRIALGTDAGYVGAMGSRKVHQQRVSVLREAGVSDEDLSRLRSPIGLDIGARGPQEVAVAVAAEIIAQNRGGTGLPLSGVTGTDRVQNAPSSRAERILHR